MSTNELSILKRSNPFFVLLELPREIVYEKKNKSFSMRLVFLNDIRHEDGFSDVLELFRSLLPVRCAAFATKFLQITKSQRDRRERMQQAHGQSSRGEGSVGCARTCTICQKQFFTYTRQSGQSFVPVPSALGHLLPFFPHGLGSRIGLRGRVDASSLSAFFPTPFVLSRH